MTLNAGFRKYSTSVNSEAYAKEEFEQAQEDEAVTGGEVRQETITGWNEEKGVWRAAFENRK